MEPIFCFFDFLASFSYTPVNLLQRRMKDRIRAAMALITTVSLVGCNLPQRNGSTPVDTSTRTSPPTEAPLPTTTPTITRTETSTRTLVPTPTPTPDFPSDTLSDYPAHLNALGDERSGVNFVTVDRFKGYWLQRSLEAVSGYQVIQKLDRMFGQLSLPVKNISDRGLNFDWRNGGQGLGFGVKDLEVLRTFEQLREIQSSSGNEGTPPISRKSEDGNDRALTLVDARDFEKVVLAYVDEHLRINGIKNPATDPSAQSQRRALFERIIYGDLGVKEANTDGVWQTVNDEFRVCETHTADAKTRSEQPEDTRNVEFDPNKEVESNNKEEETIIGHDSDNTLLVIMVTTADGSYLRVEVYDQSNPPDPENPDLDPALAEGSPARAYGGRWLPCGPGESAPGQEDTPVPTRTTIPSVTPARTQPPQPTRTPGGTGSTPRVPTPRPTPKDTEEVEPNLPPAEEPINTPSF